MLIRSLQFDLPNNMVLALISAQTELRPTNEFCVYFGKVERDSLGIGQDFLVG
jgi:hypothetical protein